MGVLGFDCFHVGRLAGTAGRVWQYTAIDRLEVDHPGELVRSGPGGAA